MSGGTVDSEGGKTRRGSGREVGGNPDRDRRWVRSHRGTESGSALCVRNSKSSGSRFARCRRSSTLYRSCCRPGRGSHPSSGPDRRQSPEATEAGSQVLRRGLSPFGRRDRTAESDHPANSQGHRNCGLLGRPPRSEPGPLWRSRGRKDPSRNPSRLPSSNFPKRPDLCRSQRGLYFTPTPPGGSGTGVSPVSGLQCPGSKPSHGGVDNGL